MFKWLWWVTNHLSIEKLRLPDEYIIIDVAEVVVVSLNCKSLA
jgi:hypothetical protein